MTRPAPVIVGAGPAGCAAAIMLARGGAAPRLLERSETTGDAICGGFLSWRSVATLTRLGINADSLGGAMVGSVRLYHGTRCVSAPLPAPGMGVSRRRLDTVMLAAASAAGAVVQRGVHVTHIDADDARDVAICHRGGAPIAAAALFLATGKHGLRGFDRTPPAHVVADPVIGLRARLPATPAIGALVAGHVELFLFDRGYAGLVLQEDGSANLCLAVHKSRLAQADRDPATLILQWAATCPALAARLDAAGGLPAQIDAIAAVPYGWRAQPNGAGHRAIWRLGDQAAVIPSLAGEGMGIAIGSGYQAATAWLSGRSADDWQRGFADATARPMQVAGAIWRIGESVRWQGAAMRLLAAMPGGLSTAAIAGAARLTRLPL
jgi:menaquinone-9 beta-reductase